LATFLLVRHGEVEGEKNLRYYGFTDIGLSPTGFNQAELLRRRLSFKAINACYASDLRRALDTAQIIASHHGLEVIPCPQLREIHFGKLEGMTFEEIEREYPQIAQQWQLNSSHLSFPEGENLTAFFLRIASFVERLKEHHPQETILIVAHDGSLRMVLCVLLNTGLKGWWRIRLDKASLSIVEVGYQGAVLSLLNDVSHLYG
jgi:alpha-ribazole phosphatase